MAVIFTQDQTGVIYEVKLFDCESNTEFDVDDIESQSIVFTKPDGTKLIKSASLTAGLVTYRNTGSEESILDLLGRWSYAGAAVLINEGGTFVTNEKKSFWVIS